MSNFKNLLLLFLCACCNGLYFNYGVFFTFIISYFKIFHPESPICIIYTVIIPLNIGVILSSALFPKTVSKIGIKNCLVLYLILANMSLIVFVYITNLLGLYLGHLLMGSSHQLMMMTIIYYINRKYPSNVVQYTGYVFTGTAVCLFWGYIFSKIMNPENQPKTRKFELKGNNVEYAFSIEISKRFPYFCVVYAISNVIFILIIRFLIEDIGDSVESENGSECNSVLSEKISQSVISNTSKLTIEETVLISENPSGKIGLLLNVYIYYY